MARQVWVVEGRTFAKPDWGARKVSVHFSKGRADHVAKYENHKAAARFAKTGWEFPVVRYVPEEEK